MILLGWLELPRFGKAGRLKTTADSTVQVVSKGCVLPAPRTVLILPGVSLATTVVLQVGDSPGLPAHRGLHSCSGRLPQLALAIALRLCFVFLSQRVMCQDTQVAEGVEPVSGIHGLPKHDKFQIFGDAQ